MQTESQYSVSQEKVTLLGRDNYSIDSLSQLRPTKNEINSLNTNLNKKRLSLSTFGGQMKERTEKKEKIFFFPDSHNNLLLMQ